MKPRLRLVKTYYWSCADPGHRHTFKDKAALCIQQSQNRFKKKWTDEKLATLKKKLDSGKTYVSIAKEYGLSPVRIGELARQISYREERAARRAEDLAERSLDPAIVLDYTKAIAESPPVKKRKPSWQHYEDDGTIFIFRPGTTPTLAAFTYRELPADANRGELAAAWRQLRKDNMEFRQTKQQITETSFPPAHWALRQQP
jgi:hypothetical protein